MFNGRAVVLLSVPFSFSRTVLFTILFLINSIYQYTMAKLGANDRASLVFFYFFFSSISFFCVLNWRCFFCQCHCLCHSVPLMPCSWCYFAWDKYQRKHAIMHFSHWKSVLLVSFFLPFFLFVVCFGSFVHFARCALVRPFAYLRIQSFLLVCNSRSRSFYRYRLFTHLCDKECETLQALAIVPLTK